MSLTSKIESEPPYFTAKMMAGWKIMWTRFYGLLWLVNQHLVKFWITTSRLHSNCLRSRFQYIRPLCFSCDASLSEAVLIRIYHLQMKLQCEKYSIIQMAVSRARNWKQVKLSDTRQNECNVCRNEWHLLSYRLLQHQPLVYWTILTIRHFSRALRLRNTINFKHFVRNGKIRSHRNGLSVCSVCLASHIHLTHTYKIHIIIIAHYE